MGAGPTVSEMEVVLAKLPEVPAVSVKVLEPAVLVGLKEPVTPLGKLDADKLTLPLKPF